MYFMFPYAGHIFEPFALPLLIYSILFGMNAALCDCSICGTLEKQLLTYLLTHDNYATLRLCLTDLLFPYSPVTTG